MTPPNRARLVKSLGAAIGFDRVGIARAGPSERAAYYKAWLAAGHAGGMEYLKRNLEFRADPSRLLAGARSIICIALSYNRPAGIAPEARNARGQVASYALGRDYHVVVHRLLSDLLARLHSQIDEPFESRICVDTAPILERDLARQAGLGWIGKNTCLLDRHLGSCLLLGEILTTLNLEPDTPVAEHCGTCTRCIDACPTKALTSPCQLDARRCISYLTIEHRGEIPTEFHPAIANWVFGCDICQQVCPYNAKAPAATNPEILADRTPATPDLLDLLRLRSGDYRRLTQGSATRRATRNMWRRNAAIALGNLFLTGQSRAQPPTAQPIGSLPSVQQVKAALTEAAIDDNPALRAAATNSLGRITS